jgi:hypothetical protein
LRLSSSFSTILAIFLISGFFQLVLVFGLSRKPVQAFIVYGMVSIISFVVQASLSLHISITVAMCSQVPLFASLVVLRSIKS